MRWRTRAESLPPVNRRRGTFTWVKSTPGIGRAFGDVSAMPTLLMFDRQGRTAGVYFGAPPSLHQEAETKLASLFKSPT